MNKRFIRVILFGALAFASASTFVGCSDYDDDIKNLQQQIDTNKDAIAKLQELVGAGKWVTKVEGIEGGIKVTMNDGTTTEIKSIGKDGINGTDGKDGINGVDGKDGSVVEIRDGYWYINGENQNIKAQGTDGKDGINGEDGKDGINGTDGKDGIDGEDGKDGINGTDGKDGTNGVDGHDVKVGSTGKLQVWDAEAGKYVDTKFEAAGAYVVADGNYWNLHVLNQSTGEYETIKLPATEIQGVTGITVMDAAALAFNYGAMTSSHVTTATNGNWAGLKGIPAADEVLFADMEPIIVQVTPYNFDLTTAKPQIVNSLGEEAPFTIDVKPYVSDKPLTRAASANGLWEITITGVKADVDAAAFAEALKIGGSNVKFALKSGDFLSTYGDVTFNGTVASTGTPAAVGDVKYNGAAVTSDVPTGKEVTLTIEGSAVGVYDSYLTVTPSDASRAAEYGIEPKGMSFTANEKAAGQTVNFTLHQMSVDGTIASPITNLAVTFATGKVTPDAPIVIDYVVSDAQEGAEVNFGTALTSISEATAATLESIEWTFTKEDGSALNASTDVPFKAPQTPASDYLNKSNTAADLNGNTNIQSNIRSVVKTTLPAADGYATNAKPGVYMANFILKDVKGNQVKVVPVKINVTLPAADDIVAKKAANFVDNTLIARLAGASAGTSYTYGISNIYTLKNGAAAANFEMEDLTETGATYAQPDLTTAAGEFWSEEKGYIPAKVQFTYNVAGNSNFAVEIPAIDVKFVSPFYGATLLVQDKVEINGGGTLTLAEYTAGQPATGITLSVKGLSTATVKLMTTDSGNTKPGFVKAFAVESGAYVSGTIDDTGLVLTATTAENTVTDKITISVTDHNDVVTKFTLDVTVK